MVLSSITGSTQCLQVNSAGNVGGTGSTCGGGGGSGTINSAPQYQIPYYSSAGTSAVLSGASGFTIQSGIMSVSALTISGIASGNQCLTANGSGVVSGSGGPCGSINSGTQYQVGIYATTGTTLSGNSGFTYNTGTSRLSVANLTLTGISGTQCLQGASGVISGTGAPCGSIAAEPQYEVPYYSASGTAATLAGSSNFTFNSSTNILTTQGLTVSSFAGSAVCVQTNTIGTLVSAGAPCGNAITSSGVAGELVLYTSATGMTGHSSMTFNGTVLYLPLINVGSVSVCSEAICGYTVYAGAGSSHNTVYRCLVAGILPVGALTITSGDCGVASATSLHVD
jgi:hypothetical protein